MSEYREIKRIHTNRLICFLVSLILGIIQFCISNLITIFTLLSGSSVSNQDALDATCIIFTMIAFSGLTIAIINIVLFAKAKKLRNLLFRGMDYSEVIKRTKTINIISIVAAAICGISVILHCVSLYTYNLMLNFKDMAANVIFLAVIHTPIIVVAAVNIILACPLIRNARRFKINYADEDYIVLKLR